jgi:hypothetical protein
MGSTGLPISTESEISGNPSSVHKMLQNCSYFEDIFNFQVRFGASTFACAENGGMLHLQCQGRFRLLGLFLLYLYLTNFADTS